MALLDGLGKALKALDCFVLGQGAYIFGSLNAFQGLDQGTTADVINAYRRLRGCDPAGDVVPAAPLPTEGQCPVAYTGRFTIDVVDGSCQESVLVSGIFGVGTGPVSFIEVLDQAFADAAGGLCPGFTHNRLFVSNSAGQSVAFDSNRGLRLTNSEFFRVDNLPDNCGGSEPPPPPPTNINIDVDVEYVDEGDEIVNITIPIEFKPFTVNFNGDVSFPIEFSLGGIDFNGDVSFFPDFRLNIGGPKLPKGVGDGVQEPGPGGEERPEAAPEDTVIGVVVIATSINGNAATEVLFENGPDIFIPRLGSVKFAYSIGGATFWSNDIDVKSPRSFIPCPFSQGADAVEVSRAVGVILTHTPIRGFPLVTVGDLTTAVDV